MKLEYLDRASPNQKPTLVFHGDGPVVVRAVSVALANLTEYGIDLSTLPGVEPVDQCSVVVCTYKPVAGEW